MMRHLPVYLGLICMLGGCLPGDGLRVSECMASLAAVEPDAKPLAVTPNATEIDRVALDYRRPGDGDGHWIVCKYDSPWWGFGGSELAGVVVDGNALGPGRLTFLKTHWIGTPGAAQDVAARLTAQG
ncbi:hypothetical protein [Aestuariivirga sp.]|uniref:hypothetical protein n=1 Tax=Aestuariivirga sp. TaxID=2650926 RepID=UPI0039E4FBAD